MLNNNQEKEIIPLLSTPVTITEYAAEMVLKTMKEDKLENHGLRIGVTGGGCSGLQYLLDFSENSSELDFESNQYGVNIYIDPFSAAHLVGTSIDYQDSLKGVGFKFNNPNIIRSCGCGSSFQT